MEIIIEETVSSNYYKNKYYSVELIKNNQVTELCNREFLEDAIKDAKWYCHNEYKMANYKGLVN